MNKMLKAALLMLVLVMAFPQNGWVDEKADQEHRRILMQIAKLHIFALDQILSGQVRHYEHVEMHAKGLRNSSQMIPHLLENTMSGSSPKALEEKKQRFTQLIEQSQASANRLVRAARTARKYQDDPRAKEKHGELVQAYRNLQKACWRCHKDIRDEE